MDQPKTGDNPQECTASNHPTGIKFVMLIDNILQNDALLQNIRDDERPEITLARYKSQIITVSFYWFILVQRLQFNKSNVTNIMFPSKRKKGRNLTQSYDKIPYTNRTVKRAKWQHKQRQRKFDFTSIADRLRTVSMSNYGHQTGVVIRFTRQPSHSHVIKRTHIQKVVNKPSYIDNKPTATPSREVIKINTQTI